MAIRSPFFHLYTSFLFFVTTTLFWGCHHHLHDASFPKDSGTIEAGSLLGPFTGQIKDERGNSLSDAWVVAEWKLLSETNKEEISRVVLKTAGNGSYSIPKWKPAIGYKVLGFSLLVHKAGYIGYRSDTRFEDNLPRKDFSQQDNLITLSSPSVGFDHRAHLAFLGCSSSCAEPIRSILQSEFVLAEQQPTLGSNTPPLIADASPNEPPPSTHINTTPPDDEQKAPPFVDAKQILASALRNIAPRFHVEALLDLESQFDMLPFVDSVTKTPIGMHYNGAHFRAIHLPETAKQRGDVAIRIWHPETQADAEALFLDLKGKLLIKRISKNQEGRIGQMYDKELHIHGMILFLKKDGLVAQISCGDMVCINRTFNTVFLDTIKKELLKAYHDSSSPQP